MLVVVQHRLPQARPQRALDLEAFGRGEILQLDRPERGLDGHHRGAHARRVPLVQEYRHAVDADHLGEQRGLALHDRQSRERADVAEAQDRGAMGDDRDGAGERGELARRARVLLDRKAHPRDAGRVDIAPDLLRVDRKTRHGAYLAAAMPVEDAVGLADEARGRQLPDAFVQGTVSLRVHLQGDLPERAALVAAQRGEVLDRKPPRRRSPAARGRG